MLTTACRLIFAAVLLPWFVIGGVSKLAGTGLSLGPAVDGLPLSLGAFYAFAPQAVSPAGGMPTFGPGIAAFVLAMTALELVLPVLVAVGLMARAAAALLILHQVIAWSVATPMAEAGGAFDASPFDMVPDQLLLWAALLAPVALFGAGPLSLDALFARTRRPPVS